MKLIKLVIEAIVGLLGVIGNSVLILVLMRIKAGWHRFSLQLVAPIAILDLVVSLLITLKAGLSMITDTEDLLESDWFCKYIGSSIAILLCLCVILISAVAVARYCHVVHERPINWKYGWAVVILIAVFICGVISTAISIEGLRHDSTMTYCRLGGHGIFRQLAFQVSSTIILSGLVIVTYSYVGVYLRCRSTLNVLPGRFLLMLLAYHLCWMPKFVQLVWEFMTDRDSVPVLLKIIAPLSLNLLHFIGPCLVIGFQSSLRKELSLFLNRKSNQIEHVELNGQFTINSYFSC